MTLAHIYRETLKTKGLVEEDKDNGHIWIEKKGETKEKSIQSGLIDVYVNVSPHPNWFRSDKGRLSWRFYVGPARMDVVDETEALQRFFEGKRNPSSITYKPFISSVLGKKVYNVKKVVFLLKTIFSNLLLWYN